MNREFYGANFYSSGRKLIHASLFLSIPALITSCNIINPAEPVPAYIHVDSFSLSTNPITQGSSTNKMTDVWAFVDGNIIGTFEMPATFPVLSSGNHTLTLRPGILVDGISATRSIYPFYTGSDTTFNFESGKIKTVIPKINYYASAKFKIEDFDQPGRNLVKYSGSDTDLVVVLNQNSFEGKSGAVYLDNSHSLFACAWKDSFLLPIAGPAYVELNYKCDNPFTVGLITYNSHSTYTEDIVSFKATQTWKKQYVSLGPALVNGVNAVGFKVYIKAVKNADLTVAALYFDNIKVVY